jgi:Flp pilus assembly protein TadG
MRVSARLFSSRRGVTAAECGVVYALTLLLIVGTIIEGLGVFRYQQIALLAREGARWASVHGSTYQQEKNASAPTSQDVLDNVITPKMVGLDATQLTCTLAMTSTTASVTISYTWTPEGFFNTPMTLTSTSIMPITY